MNKAFVKRDIVKIVNHFIWIQAFINGITKKLENTGLKFQGIIHVEINYQNLSLKVKETNVIPSWKI